MSGPCSLSLDPNLTLSLPAFLCISLSLPAFLCISPSPLDSLFLSPNSLSLSHDSLSLDFLSPLINSLSLTPGLSLLCSPTRVSPPRPGNP